MADVVVIGGGLAGVECAWQLAERGVAVKLCEQKPLRRSPAHHDEHLAELVCSNSFRAAAPTNAVGLLKEEMRTLGSLVMRIGDATRVPAGGAMAVDRRRFSEAITQSIDEHPRIEREAMTVEALPEDGQVVLATGPMTAEALAADLARIIGHEHLAYYDSIAPIITADSIVWEQAFNASRYGKGEDDAYVNCPLDKEQYHAFVEALKSAEQMQAHSFEKPRFFEGCLPIEVMAERGVDTLAYGPMKPVGLTDPRTGRRPHAVVQLRREDTEGTAYNIVGFQTRMTQPEQRRVFGLVPALARARFERFGSVHRNTFVDAPRVLDEQLRLRPRPHVRLAGQITGVEGYVESAACGLCVGRMLASELHGRELSPPPPTTAMGALLGHLRRSDNDFQPSNVVWSMFAPLTKPVRSRKLRREALGARARTELQAWRARSGDAPAHAVTGAA